MKNLKYFLIFLIIYSNLLEVKAGLNKFTTLIYVDEWLIERKVDLKKDKIRCRASLPSHATWFGARVRLGSNNELIKPIWITTQALQINESKLKKVKKSLDECRSGFLFLPKLDKF